MVVAAQNDRWRFLGKGGEHFVYQRDRRPDVVYKFFIPGIARALVPGQDREASAKWERRARRIVSRDRGRWQLLARYFPEGVLPQRKVFAEAPLLPEMADHWRVPYAPGTCPTIVTVQRYEPILQTGSYLSLSAGHAETLPQIRGYYRQINQRYLYNSHPRAGFDQAAFISVQRSGPLKRLLTAMKRDPSLYDEVTGLVARVIAYANSTGELLDLGPKDNLILFRGSSGWRHRLVDALFPIQDQGLVLARVLLSRIAAGEPTDPKKIRFLLAAVNVVRTVNALADCAGLAERIELRTPHAPGGMPDLLSLFQAWNVSRRSPNGFAEAPADLQLPDPPKKPERMDHDR